MIRNSIFPTVLENITYIVINSSLFIWNQTDTNYFPNLASLSVKVARDTFLPQLRHVAFFAAFYCGWL